jgi:3-oxoacyl-[acyl-carrier protein] reductase
MSFSEKNILVVGGSSGIGLALVKMLLADNARVWILSRKAPIDLSDSRLSHIVWDAQQPQTLAIENLPDIIHGFAYCPGTINLKPFQRLSVADFQNDFQVNVLGAVVLLQQILPRLKKATEGASVVMFSTVAAKIGMGFHASIAASKGAVEGLAKSLAAEWAASRIRVNVVAPSLTDTPLAAQLLGSPEKREASDKRHPIGRVGQAEDVANVAHFLLSEKSSWLTGQVLGIDGGMSSLK